VAEQDAESSNAGIVTNMGKPFAGVLRPRDVEAIPSARGHRSALGNGSRSKFIESLIDPLPPCREVRGGTCLCDTIRAGMDNLQTHELYTSPASTVEDAGSAGFIDVLIVLAQDWRRILLGTVIAMVLGACIAFLLLKPTFTATAMILPPQTPQSTASMLMGQLGALTSLGGGGSLLKSPADLYVGMLQSRTVADHIIEKFNLRTLWKLRNLEDTRHALANHVQFEATKDGLISITAKDHDPRRASDYANAFVDELYRLNANLAISEAAQRRVFFDEQLEEEKSALAIAENKLMTTQQKTGLISLGGQAEMAIRNIAQLQAEISSREVQMQAMRSFATDQNPDLSRLQREIDTLRQQLAQLENAQQHLAPGDTQVPAGRVPQEGLEYGRDLRDVKYHEALFELLSRQFEAARIDEAKAAPIIQVVDHAVPPDKKSGPPRLLIVIGSGFVGFCIASLWVFSRQALVRMRQIPESAAKLDQLSSSFRLRRYR
jgi:tyrosine-protein kinase Etk/Wzc